MKGLCNVMEEWGMHFIGWGCCPREWKHFSANDPFWEFALLSEKDCSEGPAEWKNPSYVGKLLMTQIARARPDPNRDGRVNILDASIVAASFGSKPGRINWNASADLYRDNIINIRDIGLIARKFGQAV